MSEARNDTPNRPEAAAVNDAPNRPALPGMTRWLTTPDVLAHLSIGRDLLKELMLATPDAGAPIPWVDLCAGNRSEYRWAADEVDDWFREVCGWRARSRSGTGGGASGGASAEPGGPTRSRQRERRSSSSARSTSASSAASRGSLVSLVKSRP